MQVNTALENYKTLKMLPPATRLRVETRDEDQTLLVPDSRWFSSARRRMDGSSRENIIEPIRATFITVYANEPPEDFLSVLEQTRQNLLDLYGLVFTELFIEIANATYAKSPIEPPTLVLDEIAIVSSPPIGTIRKRRSAESGDVIIDFGADESEDEPRCASATSKCVLVDSTMNWFREVFGCQK